MADVINLNKFRKQKIKADDKKSAVENRVKFGRTKAQKQKDAFEKNKSENQLNHTKRNAPTLEKQEDTD